MRRKKTSTSTPQQVDKCVVPQPTPTANATLARGARARLLTPRVAKESESVLAPPWGTASGHSTYGGQADDRAALPPESPNLRAHLTWIGADANAAGWMEPFLAFATFQQLYE
jgi:hypothetical protein